MNTSLLKKGIHQLGLECSEEQIVALERYSQLLLKWNKVYNLTSIRNPDEVLTHHILDSLSIIPIYRSLYPGSISIMDVGSGGGLPAIPLAIMCPEYQVTMVDTVGKKCAFLTQCIVELGLKNAKVLNTRVENIKNKTYDVLSSRAFASLSLFVQLTNHLLTDGGVWLAMKGVMPEQEIAELQSIVKVEKIYELDVPFLNENRHLVKMALIG
ncbi:MAG: 16S rRNA (guanine(527)-N(7))-methyltransferase RsmG [Burkholderiaceae bacterium]|nr:16S rRNA (guanine(527)-N(7))-methyltransferase RsmG [Burkholderiaceae bacterium]